MYTGPSCLDYPSSEELSAAEVEAQIHKILDLGVNPFPGARPIPLRRGITSVRVSTLGHVLAAFMILSFHYAHDPAHSLGGGCGELWETNPPVGGDRERSARCRTGSKKVRDGGLF
jgi:hypothetical protein